MSINVDGKNCKLWISEHQKQNGDKWFSYSIGVSKKDMTGNWSRAYQDVQFTKNADPSGVPNGTIFDFKGWMSVRTYKDKDGKEVNKPIIVINEASFDYNPVVDQMDSFEALDENVPF